MFKTFIQKTYKYRLIIGLVLLIFVLVLLVLINKNKIVKTDQVENTTETNLNQTEDLDVNNKNQEINDENIDEKVEIIEKNNEEQKVGGLTRGEILNLGSQEYRIFVNGLSDGEKDLLPGKYDISGYTNSFENDYFKIGLFNSLDMVLGVKIKGKDEEESKKAFEGWFSRNISNNRSDIEVIWISSKS